MGGLAQRRLVIKRIAQIIGDLKRLADARAKLCPSLGVFARCRCTHPGGRHEQRAGLGTVIGGKVDLRFTLPTLAGTDAAGHAAGLAQDAQKL